jgi:FkbM family methyltransferase
MSDLSPRDRILLGSYSLVKRSGLLETSLGKSLFRSAYFFYKRHIEDDLQQLIRLRPALVQAGNVLDVGANIGYTAVVLAKAIDKSFRVYAFEPESFNYAMLRRTSAQPEFENKIVAIHSAVGAEDGEIELWQNPGHHADHRVITDRFRSADSSLSGIRVPIVSIDRFLVSHPGPLSFVKIDVQGFELPVCQGMKTAIEKNPNLTIVLEYAPSAMRELGFAPSDLVEFLTSRGFQIYLVGRNGVLTPGIPSELGRSGYVDLLFTRQSPEVPDPAGLSRL